jgi:hypothetical protein
MTRAAGRSVTAVVDAARMNEARRRVGAGHLERLRGAVPADTAMLYIPELFTRAVGRRVVSQIVDALSDELI